MVAYPARRLPMAESRVSTPRVCRAIRKRIAHPVYPWNFVRTNTIFGVAAGGYTAWTDKHPSYSSVAGPGVRPKIALSPFPLDALPTVITLSIRSILDQLNSPDVIES
jgi:hypothetical protein